MRLPRTTRGRALAAGGAGALAGLAAGLVLVFAVGGGEPRLVPRERPTVRDPLAYVPSRQPEYERVAAESFSHVVYTKSPGGALASAERTARWRTLVERAVRGTDVDPDVLEAIVLLESAGDQNAIAGGADPENASGLTQILAGTAQGFLGMRVDLAESRRLTREILAAQAKGQDRRVARLRERRRRVDDRFVPRLALGAAVRYLQLARASLGRDDLAVVSYHMGIGNLKAVLRDYGAPAATTPYAQLYFDSAPDRHARAWARLASLGDSSRDYLWRVYAAREIMRLWRTDRPLLRRLAALQTAKNSAEEVLHPPSQTVRFADPRALRRALGRDVLAPLPDLAAVDLRVDERMGELAARLDADPKLYRALRPSALALLVYVGRRVRELSRVDAPLLVTSTVRDVRYQRALAGVNVQATPRYSLHTTGFAFDVARRYAKPAQAAAFQFVLERLQALGLIAWLREPGAIHVAVADRAAQLVPVELVER